MTAHLRNDQQLPEPEKLPERKAAVLKALGEFYTPGMAEAFLMERQRLLDNERPMELLRTKAGYRKVMDVIDRLRDGAYI